MALAAEHPQQVVGPDLVGDERPATRSMSGQCVVIRLRLTLKRKPSILYRPNAMSEYEALSVATISGFTPPSRFSSVSRV